MAVDAPTRGRSRAPVILASTGLGGLLLAVALVLLAPAGAELAGPVANLAEVLFSAVAAGTALWRALRSTGRRRWAWAAVAVGCGGWAAGQAMWTWYELVDARETPFPSLADAGFLVFPVAMSVALWLYAPRGGWRQRRRLLDALTVTAALALVSWSTVLRSVVAAGAEDPFAFAVSLAYPAGDLVVLVLTVLTLAATRTDRWSLGLLAAGLVSFTVADSGFAYLSATGDFSTGQAVDLGWSLGFVLIALAPLLAERASDPGAAPAPTSASVLPYLSVLVAAVVVAWREVMGGGLEGAERLLVAVTVVLVLLRQFTTLRENGQLVAVLAAREAELRHQAFHDGLTGLANRALFADRLAHALELHRSDRRPLAVLLCDLDDFKLVNDRLGHAVGDELLTRVAERLRGALRNADTLARFGGDEFAVLLEHGEQASAVASRMTAALCAPFRLAGSRIDVHVSIGVALVEASVRTPTPSDLLVQADTAMYAAKRTGKGRVRTYEPGMSLVEVEERRLGDALSRNLEDGSLEVAFQPVVRVDTGEVAAVQCLARWTWEGREVPPPVFGPVAERTGLSAELTDAVLDRACAQLAAWDVELGHDRLQVGVDVAPRELVGATLPERVRAALTRHDIRPDRLVLQIPASGLLLDLPAATRTTAALLRFGVQLALSDFGVGSFSLAHLQAVHLTQVTIDRSFTGGLGTDDEQARLFGAVLRLGQDLGLQVVAQGVERSEQLAVLRTLGCRLAQGPLLAAPCPAADLGELLRSGVTMPGDPPVPVVPQAREPGWFPAHR